MSFNFIYTIFYVLLHALYTCFKFVYDQWFYLKLKFSDHEVSANHSLQYVAAEARKFNKLPAHLTVLLGQEQHSISDLTNLILWCLAAGISFISFYDCKGQLKKRENELHLAVCDKVKQGQHVIWHGESQKYKNGYSGMKVHVKILTESDGRINIVNTAKVLAGSDKKIEDINIECINRHLREQFEFPDPDLGVYCGEIFSIYSYPPWQIRVTEFLSIKSHHNVSAKTFVDLLRRYNKCEQRLGK